MYNEVWQKYKKGFKFILPFILLQIIFESVGFRRTGNSNIDTYTLIKEIGTSMANSIGLENSIANSIIWLVFFLFVSSLFYIFLIVVIKSIVNQRSINYKENFEESVDYFTRYFGVNIIITIILAIVTLVSGIFIISPYTVLISPILIVSMDTLLKPCGAYLVYYNSSIDEALSDGVKLGKDYFWRIIFLSFIITFINILTNASTNLNIITYSLMDFFKVSIKFYILMFSMYICKREDVLDIKK